MMPPIRLTDAELEAVFTAARPLHPRDRDTFLKQVAVELGALSVRGEGAVHRAVAAVQARFWHPPLAVD
jgi:hypothetical protein